MAGRFPGAPTSRRFWRNLRDGVESISFFTDEELRGGRRRPRRLLADPRYVPGARRARRRRPASTPPSSATARARPRCIDPQQRLFLECAWEALEDAGYDPASFPGAIGVFAGAGMNTYLLSTSLADPELLDAARQLPGRCSATTRTSWPPGSPTSST